MHIYVQHTLQILEVGTICKILYNEGRSVHPTKFFQCGAITLLTLYLVHTFAFLTNPNNYFWL